VSALAVCPECGAEAESIRETVTVYARLKRNGNGYEYAGTTDVDWDSQETDEGPEHEVYLLCPEGHTWEVYAGHVFATTDDEVAP
jgi:hypothetical protein